MTQALWLDKFIKVYSELGTDNLRLLEQVYHPNIEFTDPMHRVEGRETLLNYFEQIYSQVISCQFIIDDVFLRDDQAAIYWTMTFRHQRLNRQKPITVQGHSRIRGNGESVIFHRDYLDLGAMLYEHLPLVGALVRNIKGRAGKA